MECPTFNIGDLVEFEISPLEKKNRPRWQLNKDTGKSGIWAQGRIQFIDDKYIRIRFGIKGYVGFGDCTIPNRNNPQYDPAQWIREGFLKRVACECGSQTVYGQSFSLHSGWCPLYNYDCIKGL